MITISESANPWLDVLEELTLKQRNELAQHLQSDNPVLEMLEPEDQRSLSLAIVTLVLKQAIKNEIRDE